jgi:magnesium transporter
LHRVVLQLREALRLLLREETPLIQRATQTYLRDCYDHAVQLFDLVTSDQEAAAGLMEYYQSIVSNRMNEIMKVLTIMASIFIPLTFVVGIYGMNFDFMPELRYRWAYPALMAFLFLVALGMIGFFRHRRWVGGRSRKH